MSSVRTDESDATARPCCCLLSKRSFTLEAAHELETEKKEKEDKHTDTKRTNTFAGTVQTFYRYERHDEFLGVRLGS